MLLVSFVMADFAALLVRSAFALAVARLLSALVSSMSMLLAVVVLRSELLLSVTSVAQSLFCACALCRYSCAVWVFTLLFTVVAPASWSLFV